MSSLRPISETSNFYLRDLSQVEDEIRNEGQKTRERHDEQLRDLEARYKNSLKKQQEDSETAIQSAKKAGDEALGRENENHGAAIARLRDEAQNNRGVSGAGYSADGSLVKQYRKTIEELQKELDESSDKFKESHQAQLKNLEENHRTELARKEQESNQVIHDLKETRHHDLQLEKEQIDSELNRLRDHVHERKPPSVPHEVYKREVEGLQKDAELRHAFDVKATDDYRAESEKRSQDLGLLQTEKIEELSKQHAENLKELQDKTRVEKDHLYETIDRLKQENNQIEGSTVPYKNYKRDLNSLTETAQTRHEADAKNIDSIRNNTDERLNLLNQKQTDKIRKLEDQQAEEIRVLKNQVNELNEYNNRVGKKHSEDLTQSVREFENSARTENQRLSDSYEATLQKMKDNYQNIESEYARRGNEVIQKKEADLTQTIIKQNQENKDRIDTAESQFRAELKNNELAKKENERQTSAQIRQTLSESEEYRNEALKNQAKNFQNTITHEKKTNDEQIHILEKSLQLQKTSPDVALMSPSMETNLRKNLIQEYEKMMNAEVERNKESEEHLNRTYHDTFEKTLEEYKDKETDLNARKIRDDISQRARFMESMNETEYATETKLREQEKLHDREKDQLTRRFYNTLERQKREYNQIFEADRNYSNNRISELQGENEANLKMAIRIANTKQNDLIHDYEKKIMELKSESDLKLEDQKVTAQAELKEIERRSKQELEAQTKNYEQKIAQIEQQNREHERYVSQNYQDELDRIRRSYEILSKKKS